MDLIGPSIRNWTLVVVEMKRKRERERARARERERERGNIDEEITLSGLVTSQLEPPKAAEKGFLSREP